MSEAWERVWIDFYDESQTSGAMVGKVYATDLGDVEYIRADVSAARIADLTRQLAEARDVKPQKPPHRPTTPAASSQH